MRLESLKQFNYISEGCLFEGAIDAHNGLKIVKALVKKNANINETSYGIFPYEFTTCGGREEIRRYLIEESQKQNILLKGYHPTLPQTQTELIKNLVYKNDLASIKKFYSDSSLNDSYLDQAFETATKVNDLPIIKSLIEDFEYTPHWNSLCVAAHKNQPAEIKDFLTTDVIINASLEKLKKSEPNPYSRDERKLCNALISNNMRILRYLIKNNLTERFTNYLSFPIYIRSHMDESKYIFSLEAYKYLIKDIVDISKKRIFDESALHIAVSYKNSEIITFLIESGCNLEDRNRDGKTPLHLACDCEYYDFDLIKTLIELGANINTVDNYGWSPLKTLLHEIDSNDSEKIDIAKYLIDKGADINSIFFSRYNEEKMSLFKHYASTYWSLSDGTKNINALIKFLIEIGADDADVNLIQVNYGIDPDFFVFLKAHGYDINRKDSLGETQLTKAVKQFAMCFPEDSRYLRFGLASYTDKTFSFTEEIKQIKFLIDNGADPFIKNNNGESLLYYAVKGNSIKLVQYFLKLGLDLNELNNHGESLLFHAAKHETSAMYDYLVELDLKESPNQSEVQK